MSAKPSLSVRLPRNIEAFVNGGGQPLAANALASELQAPSAQPLDANGQPSDPQPSTAGNPAAERQAANGPLSDPQPSTAGNPAAERQAANGQRSNAEPWTVVRPGAEGQALGPQPSAASGQPLEPQVSAASRSKPKLRGVMVRKSGEEVARLSVYIEPEIAGALKRYCFEQGLQVSEVAADAITRHVRRILARESL